jgi:hypothetical protein
VAFTLPSIPSLPSIPDAPRIPSFSPNTAAVLNVVSLIASNLPGLNPPRAVYAILDAVSFIPLTVPTTWLEFAQRGDAQVSDYPIEDSAFAAYNKVRRPTIIDVTLTKDGSDLARATWLEAIRQQMVANPLGQYHILTPQGIWQNFTITRISHQTRQDRGSNLLYLDLQFSEVPKIEAPSLVGDNAVDPEAGPMRSIGRVFPTDTPAAVASLARTNAPTGSALAAVGA